MQAPSFSTAERTAVGYIRASTEDQVNTLEVQKLQLTKYCEMHGIRLVEVFVDSGVSGSVPFADRPESGALVEFLEQTTIREIVFTKVDRAFRDSIDCLLTFRDFETRGYQLHALDLGIDTTTPTGRLILGVLALFAEWELARRRERQGDVIAGLRRQGRKIGEVPYGSRAITDPSLPKSRRDNPGQRLVPDPEEQAVLHTIFELHGSHGWGAQRIATHLTRIGIPTKKGGDRWASSTVEGLLANSRLEDGRTATDFRLAATASIS